MLDESCGLQATAIETDSGFKRQACPAPGLTESVKMRLVCALVGNIRWAKRRGGRLDRQGFLHTKIGLAQKQVRRRIEPRVRHSAICGVR
jgi:hypothetical protein